MRDPHLYSRIAALRIGDERHALLRQRLRASHGWSDPHTSLVLHEYQRFIYLMAVSPVPLAPSPAVDRVWHCHLCFTESYWDTLCRDTVGRPLHHHPDPDPHRNAARRRALAALYEEEFGSTPTAAVWEDHNPTRRRVGLGTAAVLTLVLLLTAPTARADDLFADGADALSLVLMVLGALVFLVWRGKGGGSNGEGCAGGGG